MDDSLGHAPDNAFPADYENGMTLFSCRAEVEHTGDDQDHGLHPGKLVGESCNIPYGGVAYFASAYSVLVIKAEDPARTRAPAWVKTQGPLPDAVHGYDLAGRKVPAGAKAAIFKP